MSAGDGARSGQALAARLSHHMLEVLLVLACVILAFAAPGFLSVENLMGVLRSVSEIGIIAFGMTMVIIAGEIDLSAGSGAAFAGCLVAWLVSRGVPVAAAIVAALAAGAAFGASIGFLRARFEIGRAHV